MRAFLSAAMTRTRGPPPRRWPRSPPANAPRKETRLEGGGRQIHPFVDHAVEKALEALRVAGHHLGVAVDPRLAREEQAEHPADVIRGERHAGAAAAVRKAPHQRVGRRSEALVEAGHRNRASVARPAAMATGLPDSVPAWYTAERGEPLHDVAPAAEGADRHAAADDLAESGHVRADAVELLRAAAGDAEAGNHLVEDQQRAVSRSHSSRRVEEALRRRHAVHVAGHRLDDDAGDLRADLPEHLAHLLRIVVVELTRGAARAAGTPGEVGMPKVSGPEPGLDQQRSAWPW